MNTSDLAMREPETLLQWLDKTIGIFGFTELTVTALFVFLTFAAPRLASRSYERIEQLCVGLLGSHPTRQIIAIGLLAVGARATMLPWLGAPAFAVHDEQSLLLQAQTYMAGRLANPVHPFWEHFESFHINQIPAYASMYFPGRGAPLAAGLLVSDQPWLGVWLSFVLMSMAAVWMLQAWVSLPLAVLGGFLVVTRLGLFSYWVNSYWGGAFTALGGMLVIGALPRILAAPRWYLGVLMGLGALILMTTRPYEGVLLCIPVGLALLWRWAKPAWKGEWQAPTKIAVPVAAFVAAGGVLLLLYNQATTGHALKTPYSLNRDTYAVAPAFLVSPPVQSAQRGPAYFRDFYEAEASSYERRGSTREIVRALAAKVFHSWNFYLGTTFTAAFLAGLWAARQVRFLVGTLLFFFAGYALETWNFPHYTSPIYAVVLIVMMRGFAMLRTFEWRHKPVGLFLTRAMPTASLLLLLVPMFSLWFGHPVLKGNTQSTVCCVISDQNLRSRVVQQLKASPGRDIVLVKDGPNNPIHFEFVYNDADIDHSEIVWARSLSPARDLALQRYFSDRQLWEFEWENGTAKGYRLEPMPRLRDAH